MAIISDYVDRMVECGMDRNEAMQIAGELMAAGALAAATRPSNAALRTRRWREKKASQSVTGDASVVGAESHQASQTVTCDASEATSQNVTERHKPSHVTLGDKVPLSIENKITDNLFLEREVPSKSKASRAKPRGRLPEDWQLGLADRAYAVDRQFSADQITVMFERFSNHHRSRGSVMADWHAAWRTWVGNEIKFSGDRNGNRVIQSRADSGAGRATARETQFVARMGESALRYLKDRNPAGQNGEISACSGAAISVDPNADPTWFDFEARGGTR